MTRYVYVTAMESGSGKSAVVLGLADVLSRRAGRLVLFRPLIASADPPDPDIELVRRRYGLAQTFGQSYALTPEDLHDMDGRGEYDRLLTRVLDRCATVSAGADVAVVEGSDFTSASLPVELDLNVDAARNLGAPVLLVVGGRRPLGGPDPRRRPGRGRRLDRTRVHGARGGVQPGRARAGRGRARWDG